MIPELRMINNGMYEACDNHNNYSNYNMRNIGYCSLCYSSGHIVGVASLDGDIKYIIINNLFSYIADIEGMGSWCLVRVGRI